MPTVPTRAMFWRTLESSPSLPSAFHWAAWRHAVQHKDTDLQRLLIARLDAPEGLVATYATLTSIDLRGVYLGRGGSSVDEIVELVAGERRAAVLSDALKRSKNHPAVIKAAAEAFIARPSKALADQMRSLPARRYTPALAEAVLRAYDKYPTNESVPVSGLLTAVGHLGRSKAEALLPHLKHPSVVCALIEYDIDAELVLDALNRVVPSVLQQMCHKDNFKVAIRQMSDLIEGALRGRPSNTEIATLLRRLLTTIKGQTVTDLRAMIDRRTKAGSWTRPWPADAGDETRTVVQPDELLEAAPSLDVEEAVHADLMRLALSHDPAVLTQVVERLVRDAEQSPQPKPHQDLVRQLLHNRALERDQVHELMDVISYQENVWRDLSDFDALAWFPGDPHVTQTWCENYPATVLQDHGWAPFGGNEVARDLVLHWAESDAKHYKAAVSLALKMGLDAETLLKLPVRSVSELWTSYAHKQVGNTTLVLAMEAAVTALGNNPASWLMFERCIDTFPGTFEELLATCQAATA